MQIDVNQEALMKKVRSQFEFITGAKAPKDLDCIINKALISMHKSLKDCKIKQAKSVDGNIEFKTRHIGQYAMFLYFLSRLYYENGEEMVADDISYINSTLNSIFLNHTVNMPKHFYLDHPLATIIGRANIGEYFFCSQSCTIGAVSKNNKLLWPNLGKHVEMMSGSSIIGDCNIGNYVILASHCLIKNRNIPDNCIVFGQDYDIVIKQYSHEEMLNHMVCF